MRPNHALSNYYGMHAQLSDRVRGYNSDRCMNLRHFFACMCSVVSGKTAWRHQLVSAFPVRILENYQIHMGSNCFQNHGASSIYPF